MFRLSLKLIATSLLLITQQTSFGYSRFIMPTSKILQNDFQPVVKLGIDIIQERDFDLLAGKNVGILTNVTEGNSEGKLSRQVISNARNCNLIATFEPYNGILDRDFSPLESDLADLLDLSDKKIYQRRATITKAWLNTIDVLVIDLQDTGSRFCTNISSMIYALAACFECGVEVIILDRPNPIGPVIGGPLIEEDTKSFLGPIIGMPMFHGITIGEVANYLKESNTYIEITSDDVCGDCFGTLKITPDLMKSGKLTIVPVKGWKRDMTWANTGLIYGSTSQKFRDDICVNDFAINSLAFFCCALADGGPIFNFHHLQESDRYFACISSEKADIVALYSHLEAEYFDLMTGLQLSYIIDDTKQCLFVNTFDIKSSVTCGFSLYLISEVQKLLKPWVNLSDEKKDFLRKCIGDNELCSLMFSGKNIDPRYFINKWTQQTQEFWRKVSPYLLY